jgi:hypothetical protein
MRIRKLTMSRLARVAAFAGLALLLASPAWAGQVGVTAKTTLTTILQTDTGTHADTALSTSLETMLGTIAETNLETLVSTKISTLLATETGSHADTFLETVLYTAGPPLPTASTVILTETGTHADTLAATNLSTFLSTSADTLVATGANTFINTGVATETGSHANTLITTIIETINATSAPLNVSIQIEQEGLNLSSPFTNVLKTGAIINKVGVNNSSGLTQVAAQSGNANVSVASNAILDGPTLVDIVKAANSSVAAKEIGVLTLVPGFALQNSTKATTAHIAGLALTAAEGSHAIDDALGGTNPAVEISHSGINEYSPNGNLTLAGAVVENVVGVSATSGVTQVQAQAGSANVGGAHNLLLINGTFNANGAGLNFNR